MRVSKPKLRSVWKAHGGKALMTNKLIPIFESRPIFVDGFCYGASIPLNIDMVKSNVDKVYCFDINPDVILSWQTLQQYSHDLLKELTSYEYTQDSFGRAKYLIDRYRFTPIGIPQIDIVAAIIVKNRFSRGGLGETFATSNRLRGGRMGDENAWLTFLDQLPAVAAKISNWTFDVGSFEKLMDKHNLTERKDVCVYADPPYVESTRSAKKAYGPHEMVTYNNERDNNDVPSHEGLLDYLQNRFAGVSYLSGYHNELYDRVLKDNVIAEWNVKNNAGQNKKKGDRTEVLWRIGK